MDAPGRVRPRTLASLLAGRSAYRASQLLATVALLPVWGTARYGIFGGAVATFSWIVALLVAGPEKTVLKLLPRAPRTGPLIVRAAAAVLWAVPAPVLAAFAVSALVAPHGAVAVYLGAATTATMTGVVLLLVGLHRAMGRPWYDSRTFLALAAVQLGLLGLAAAGLGPLGYLAALAAAQTALCVPLLLRLGRPSLVIRHRPAFVRRIACTVALMGTPEVCLYLCTSVLVALLSASAFRDQVGPLVVVDVVWSAGVNLLLYVLRVYTPWVSVRLVGAGGASGRRTALRVVRWVVAADLAYLAVLGAAGAELFAASRGPAAPVVWAVLLLARTPMLMAVILAGYLVENSDAASTRITGLAAAVGLAAAALSGVVAVPLAGGVGLLAALAVAEVAQAATLWHRLARRPAPAPVEEDVHVAA
ncbi:hypothetical protein ACFFX1_43270 [Dactylosporangium sucinum]|uniref:Uncharacterized protein n=1 Tax=Dactylosporangium sucinum TaxID=1424081 RepID=A0A917U164_9ACTN|nr:hypothetical protein [Dactylosporangium sucinum]GGM45392.1 hypothetical protein GCM10007977_053710 [Dactylosporangium sucinum]